MNENDIEVLKGKVHALSDVLIGLIASHHNPKFFYELMKSGAVGREQAKSISILSAEALSASDRLADFFLGLAAKAAKDAGSGSHSGLDQH